MRNRRGAFRTVLVGGVLALWLSYLLWAGIGAGRAEGATEGKYKASWKSLRKHAIPEWYADAKFGVWTVWGPHCVPAYGSEWYGHHMYRKGSKVYKHHVKEYADPSEFGYKDFFPMWEAEKFNPDRWATLYKKAGARFAGLMAIYHDGLAKWDTDVTPWNTVKKGPGIDIVAKMEEAIKKRDMKFVLCFHHGANYEWFTEKLRGKEWAQGYDIWDPAYNKLYRGHTDKVTGEFVSWWKALLTDAVARFRPDLIWHDFGLEDMPESARQEVLAHYYNRAAKWGKEVGFVHKRHMAETVGIYDYERGWGRDNLKVYGRPWQTDTAVMTNSWGYVQNPKYKSVDTLVDGIVDRASKNGNTMLAIAPRASGVIPKEQREQLLEIGDWLDLNGQAIYGSRPWGTAQEGRYLRFTQKDGMLYVIALEWPEDGNLEIRSLSRPAEKTINRIRKVRLLGHDEALEWNQDEKSLTVTLPSRKPCDYAFVLQVNGTRMTPVALPDQSVKPNAEGRLILKAADGQLHGDTPLMKKEEGIEYIGRWGRPRDYVTWDFSVPGPGRYTVKVMYSAAEGAGGKVAISVGDGAVHARIRETGGWGTFKTVDAGELPVNQGGTHTLKVKPAQPPHWKSMGLRAVKLIPKEEGT